MRYSIFTGSVYVREGYAIATLVGSNGYTERLKFDHYAENIVYTSELLLIRNWLESRIAEKGPKESLVIDITSSTPSLVSHLRGDTVPYKQPSVRIHNEIIYWWDVYDLSIEAKWVHADQNPAQLWARQEKHDISETTTG